MLTPRRQAQLGLFSAGLTFLLALSVIISGSKLRNSDRSTNPERSVRATPGAPQTPELLGAIN